MHYLSLFAPRVICSWGVCDKNWVLGKDMFDCLSEAHGHEVYESGLFIALATEYVC